MANDSIKTLVDIAFEQLKSGFKNSKILFSDETKHNNLFHAAEYGAYRERLISGYLNLILPKKFGVGTGFIVNCDNQVSTQCDVIIYDKSKTPLLDAPNNARFFPVETVSCVIEVKSTLTLKNLNTALEKIFSIKKLKKVLYDTDSGTTDLGNEYIPENEVHQFGGVIICDKLDFNIQEQLENIFLPTTDKSFANNIILSLNDGIIMHYYEGNKGNVSLWPYYFNYSYPANAKKPYNKLSYAPNDQNTIFISQLLSILHHVTAHNFDILPYLRDSYRSVKRK